jgi:hypothetical protein
LVEVLYICIEDAARVVSHEGSAGGRGILAAHFSRNVHKWHWLGERDAES